MDRQPKYPVQSYFKFPIIFGGVVLMLGSAFFMRKKFVFDNAEEIKMMYRSENSNAKQELLAMKRELGK